MMTMSYSGLGSGSRQTGCHPRLPVRPSFRILSAEYRIALGFMPLTETWSFQPRLISRVGEVGNPNASSCLPAHAAVLHGAIGPNPDEDRRESRPSGHPRTRHVPQFQSTMQSPLRSRRLGSVSGNSGRLWPFICCNWTETCEFRTFQVRRSSARSGLASIRCRALP